MPRKKYALFIIILFAVLLFLLALGLFHGSVRLSLSQFAGAVAYRVTGVGDETAAIILFDIRIPRLLAALCVGVCLAMSGAAFQGFFRNSLADPYVIGVSSGAALGAALAMSGGLTLPVQLASFGGALAAVLLVFVISRAFGTGVPAVAILLSGTALGAFFSALLSLVMVLRDRSLYRVYLWLLGSLAGANWRLLFSLLPLMLSGCVIIALSSRPLDLLLQGDETAESLGLNARKARIVIAIGASLAAAAAVSLAGIIGFVGLVAPHSVRLVTGPSHGRLLPAAGLAGAILVIAADIIARSVLSPVELPIGIVASLFGAPFFLYLLARHGRNLGRLT